MWVKQFHKPPMTGNNYRTYMWFDVIWRMVYGIVIVLPTLHGNTALSIYQHWQSYWIILLQYSCHIFLWSDISSRLYPHYWQLPIIISVAISGTDSLEVPYIFGLCFKAKFQGISKIWPEIWYSTSTSILGSWRSPIGPIGCTIDRLSISYQILYTRIISRRS